MSRWRTVRLYTRAHIDREQNKSRTATEDDPILVWVSFLADEDKRINDSQRQRFCTCEKHIKELSVSSWTAVIGPRKFWRWIWLLASLPDSESGQHWTRVLHTCSPKCQCFQKHGNPERNLVESNFCTKSVSHGDQSFPQHSYNGNVQVHNY